MENATLYEQLRLAVARFPHNDAARFENKVWNYEAFLRQVDKAARKLRRLGVAEGDVIAVSLPNCPDALFLLYAINEVGAISYNIHPLTPPAQMKSMLERSKAKMLFVLSLTAKQYREQIPLTLRIVAINPYRHVSLHKMIAVRAMSQTLKGITRYWMVRPIPKKAFSATPKTSSDDAVYLNTGGTNGEPKIVRLSNGAINALAYEGYPLVGGDVKNIKMLTAIPLFHGFGLSMGAHTILSIGGCTVLMLKFKTKDAIKILKKGLCHLHHWGARPLQCPPFARCLLWPLAQETEYRFRRRRCGAGEFVDPLERRDGQMGFLGPAFPGLWALGNLRRQQRQLPRPRQSGHGGPTLAGSPRENHRCR
jgi:long-chain acyl-CoA synthetase